MAAQPRSSVEVQVRAPLWWYLLGGTCAQAGGGLFSGGPPHPEHPCCMGSSGFAVQVSGGRSEGSACAPFLLQPNPSYK